MPFSSEAQRRFMFSQHPDIAKRWVAEAHRNGKPVVADADLTRPGEGNAGPMGFRAVGGAATGSEHRMIPAHPAHLYGPGSPASMPHHPRLYGPGSPNARASVADMDLAEYRRQLAAAYHEMTRKPAAQTFHDANLDAAAAAYQANPTPQNFTALHQAQIASDQANAPPPSAAPAAPQGPTALPDTTDQPWMADKMPEPMQGTPATGLSQAEEKAEIAQGRKQEEADEKAAADAKKPKSIDAGKLGLADAESPDAKGEAATAVAPGYDRSLIAPARAVTVAAHETPTLDPGRIAQLGKDQDAIIGAQNEMGQAQDQAVRAQADAAQQKSQLLAEQQADMLRKAQERDAYLQRQEQHIAELSNDVAKEKVDPWKNKTGWDRARYALAAALGGFVSGFRGTPNYAMQEINTQLNREMEIQREEIERKKGRIGDMQGVLANAYRRFGNLDQAEAAARAVALQQLDAEQQAWAARNGDPVQMAKSKLLSQQMKLDADKFKASLFQYQPARTVSAGGVSAAQQKEIGEKAFQIRQAAAANGHDITPEEARRQAAATMGLTASTGTPYADISKAPAGAKGAKSLENVSVPEAPSSVEWHPERNIQGTDAQKNLIDQQQYNFAVAATLKKAMGERVSPEMLMDVGKGFVINPGDSQETIQRKNEGLKSYVASVQAGANPTAPAAEKLPEGEPEPED